MGIESYSKYRKVRHHLPVDEMNFGDSRVKGPVYGSRHGKNSRTFHSRKDVDIIKFDYINHQHSKGTANLDGIPTLASSNN